MLILKSIRKHQDRSMVHPKTPTYVHFHCAHGFYTQTLASLVDSSAIVISTYIVYNYQDNSLVRVSRRVANNHYASILAKARTSVSAGYITFQAITLSEKSYVPRIFIQPPKLMLARWQKSTPSRKKAKLLQTSLIASASLSTISRTV